MCCWRCIVQLCAAAVLGLGEARWPWAPLACRWTSVWLQVTVVAMTQNLALGKLLKKEQFPSWTHLECYYLSLWLQLWGTCRPCCSYNCLRLLWNNLLGKMIFSQFQLKISILFGSDWKYFNGFGNCFNSRGPWCAVLCFSVHPPGLEEEWTEALMAAQLCSQNWAVSRAPDSPQLVGRFPLTCMWTA